MTILLAGITRSHGTLGQLRQKSVLMEPIPVAPNIRTLEELQRMVARRLWAAGTLFLHSVVISIPFSPIVASPLRFSCLSLQPKSCLLNLLYCTPLMTIHKWLVLELQAPLKLQSRKSLIRCRLSKFNLRHGQPKAQVLGRI